MCKIKVVIIYREVFKATKFAGDGSKIIGMNQKGSQKISKMQRVQ